jgi:hypothetical protein
MIATRRFLEMARKKAMSVSGNTVEPYDVAISKKRPSHRVTFWQAFDFVKLLAGRHLYLLHILPCDCTAKTVTQSITTSNYSI